MLSIVTHARNDNYGGLDWNGKSYIDRVYEALSANIKSIEKLTIPYEYIIAEWCSSNEYLMNLPRFKELFENNKNLRTVSVKKDVAVKENLNPEQYFEYFAKNAGIRQSTYENLLVINSDIIIYPATMKVINDMVLQSLKDEVLYKFIWRYHGRGPHPQEQTGIIKCNEPRHMVHAGGAMAGDIMLMTMNGFIIYGHAYDEMDPHHRELSHSGMDTEFCVNWETNGGRIEWIDASYWHINHHHPNVYAKTRVPTPYKYKSNWGFIDYNISKINDQLTIIE